jgi:filamentous hemagglutinin
LTQPREAGAATELQNYLGGSLERIKTADARADFVFTSGPHQGKTVDFMFTPNDFNSAAKTNQFFEKNLARNEAQLLAHIEKADLVPLDFRFLSEQNQKLFMEAIDRLPLERQAQVIILR